ncbi:MAG: prepilin-type N-terminal cleavage/methylation domain-containing protein [Candidatus Rokubacteria bacterium]|nr:prepilin-type N-terminal cleavage/methylation domain-containing protein [Candidatus Rokubacteria bacterium]
MSATFVPPRGRERGFTLAEVLVATFVLSIGLVAVATGFQYATSGVETGRGETMATFLVEQKLEQLKALALADWSNAALNAGTSTEGYGSIGGASAYRRVTTIADNPGGTCTANCKRVQVTVFYKPVTGRGQLDQERQVDVITMFVSRT